MEAHSTPTPEAVEAELRAQQHAETRHPRDEYADWPWEGGGDRPQPWDLRALGLEQEATRLEPGEPNTVAPVVVEHDRPILTSGSSDSSVHDLGHRLAELLDEPNSVTRGENPFGTVDRSLMGAVNRFRARFGVEEAPDPFGGETDAGRALAAQHIGPYTWEAVLRASDRHRADD